MSYFPSFLYEVEVSCEQIFFLFIERCFSVGANDEFGRDHGFRSVYHREWVSSMVLLAVVLYDHSTLGSSSAQSPFRPVSLAFKVCLMILLTASTCPFAYG
ncbi:hypothetical protein ACOSQ2_031444 [Xanthoceras sorbifolium]